MALVCPYCRTEVVPGQEDATACQGCGTPHHVECYAENGGCTLFGCRFAPPDDPKVQITAGEVSQGGYGGASVVAMPTGFGDVSAGPLGMAAAVATEPLPPPPPPPPTAENATIDSPGDTPTGIVIDCPITAAAVLLNQRPQPKSRLTFILLGIFLGSLGAHNFYAGYKKRAIIQLLLTVCTVFYASFVTWIWALVEVCTVNCDHANVPFA